MKKFWFLALAIPLAFLSAPQAQADPCPASTSFATLETLGSCTIGDKTFSGFDFLGGDIAASDITATAVNDGTNFGFIFQMSFSALNGESKDFSLRYDAAVTSGAALITDVTSRQNSTVVGVGSAAVGETVCVGGRITSCLADGGHFEFLDTTDAAPFAQIIFDPVSVVGIEKDFAIDTSVTECPAQGPCVFNFASLSVNQNTVSQTVPEPATLLLLGSGLVGVATWSRKKFRK